jgi:surface antigen
MRRLLLAASILTLSATGLAVGAEATAQRTKAPPPAPETAAQRLERIRAENAAREAQYRADVARYEQEVREVEAQRARDADAQRQYERDLARHNEEVARNERDRRRYERRRAAYDARMARRNRSGQQEEAAGSAAAPPVAEPTAAPVSAETAPGRCAERRRSNRRTGRVIGGIAGGIAGGVLGRGNTLRRVATVALSAPAGALIGDAIAGLLDCDEQRQAAAATEEAVRGGVGTTVAWESESRPGVTGTSTVTAVEPVIASAPEGPACMTVTDVVIIDGEETRAPKRMCRRPPNNRYVRV